MNFWSYMLGNRRKDGPLLFWHAAVVKGTSEVDGSGKEIFILFILSLPFSKHGS